MAAAALKTALVCSFPEVAERTAQAYGLEHLIVLGVDIKGNRHTSLSGATTPADARALATLLRAAAGDLERGADRMDATAPPLKLVECGGIAFTGAQVD